MNANTPHDANAVAPDVDHTIDRALSALRDAQPRHGLEGRILASLEHRTITAQPLRSHFSIHLALWTATAAAILAIASMMILHRRTVEPATQAVILSEASHSDAKSKDPNTARATTNPEPFSTTNLAHPTQTVSSRPERRSLAAVRSGETCISDHRDAGCPALDAERQDGAATTPTDAQLLADLHAPSHPAPPLPLTSEEKLFLRMLRYGNLTQLAELNPEVRAKQSADETAAFKAFFPDPPPLQQPNGDTE
jgi:hypothetical protein